MYTIYRIEFGRKIPLCSQAFENKEQFKSICKNLNYEIYLDDKNVSNKYRPKSKQGDSHE